MPFTNITPESSRDHKNKYRNIAWIHGFGIALEHEGLATEDADLCELLWDSEAQTLGFKLSSTKTENTWELKEANNMKVIYHIAQSDLEFPYGVYHLEKVDRTDCDYICDLKKSICSKL